MAVQSWENLNRGIVQEKLHWREVQEQLLNILVELERLRREDRIPEGRYRQKGNYFRDTVIALIEASCRFKLYEQELPGRTDRHRVDICYLQNYENPRQGFVLLAGEVKAMASPEHKREGKRYPERTLTIDIDKRIKEVKYTSIDLKRLADPTVSKGWCKFIRESPPAFFTAWLLRLAAQDRLEHVFEKLKGISEYANGVGVAMYREWSTGQYKWIEEVPKPLLTISEFIESICQFLRQHV